MMDQYFTAPSFLYINQESYVFTQDLSMGIKHESICYRLNAQKIFPRIVSAFLRIVSPSLHTVRKKLTDTKFFPVIVTMTPFSCATMAQFLFSRKLFANGDCHLRTDIQVELPHF